MEALVQLIIDKLLAREKKTFYLSAKQPGAILGVKEFVENKHIRISDMDVYCLEKFAQKKEEPFIQALYQSFDYCCRLSFELSFEELNLIPEKILLKCPVTLYTPRGKRIVAFNQNFLTYSQVASLTCEDILVLTEKQKLTALAKERVIAKKISVFERS